MLSIKKLIAMLFTSLSNLEKEVKNALSIGLAVSDDLTQTLLNGREFRERVNESKFATEQRARFTGRALESAATALIDLQFRFLTSMYVEDQIKAKVESLRPDIWNRYSVEIVPLRASWEGLLASKNPKLSDLRNVYTAYVGKVDEAKKYQIEDSIRQTFAPTKPRPVPRGNKRSARDQQIRAGMKNGGEKTKKGNQKSA